MQWRVIYLFIFGCFCYKSYYQPMRRLPLIDEVEIWLNRAPHGEWWRRTPPRLITDWTDPILGKWIDQDVIDSERPRIRETVVLNYYDRFPTNISRARLFPNVKPTYLVMKNVLVLRDCGALVTSDYVYFPDKSWNRGETTVTNSFLGRFGDVNRADKAIVWYHLHPRTFYHVFIETMPGYLGLPRHLWEQSEYFRPRRFMPEFGHHLMSVMDLHPKSIHQLCQHLLVKELYVPCPTAGYGHDPIGLRSMRDVIMKRLNASANASYILFVQRKVGRDRHVSNIDEVELAIKTAFPNEDFRIVEDPSGPLKTQIELFRGAKMIVGIHGSQLAGMLWMKEGTVLIEIRANKIAEVFVEMSWSLGMKVFTTTVPFRKKRLAWVVLNVSVAVDMIGEGLKHLEEDKAWQS